MKEEFSTSEVCRILDIKFEKLRAWTKEGFVKPTFLSPGQGRKAIFTRLDVYLIALFDNLIREVGFVRKIGASFVRSFKTSEKTVRNSKYLIFKFPAPEGHLAPSCEHIYYAHDENSKDLEFEMLFNLIKNDMEDFTNVHIVNFHKIKHDIDIRIKNVF